MECGSGCEPTQAAVTAEEPERREPMSATLSTAIDFVTVFDFACVRRQPTPPPGGRERVRPKRGRGSNCSLPSTAEIERLTQLVIAEMVRAVRWRRGQGVGQWPPDGG